MRCIFVIVRSGLFLTWRSLCWDNCVWVLSLVTIVVIVVLYEPTSVDGLERIHIKLATCLGKLHIFRMKKPKPAWEKHSGITFFSLLLKIKGKKNLLVLHKELTKIKWTTKMHKFCDLNLGFPGTREDLGPTIFSAGFLLCFTSVNIRSNRVVFFFLAHALKLPVIRHWGDEQKR